MPQVERGYLPLYDEATQECTCLLTVKSMPQVEKEYLPLYDEVGLGLTTWSPLYSGLLTGKYLDNQDSSARLNSDAWKDMAVGHWKDQGAKHILQVDKYEVGFIAFIN